jgi:hypothetical protein
MLSLSISYPYLIESHDFANKIQQGMKHQMGGCNSGRTGPNQNVRTGSFSKQDAMWEPGRIPLDGCHWKWELRSGYLMSFSLVLHRFSSNRWEPPNAGFNHWFQFFDYFRIRELSGFDETLQNFIYKHTVNLENVQMNKKKKKGEFTSCQVSSN